MNVKAKVSFGIKKTVPKKTAIFIDDSKHVDEGVKKFKGFNEDGQLVEDPSNLKVIECEPHQKRNRIADLLRKRQREVVEKKELDAKLEYSHEDSIAIKALLLDPSKPSNGDISTIGRVIPLPSDKAGSALDLIETDTFTEIPIEEFGAAMLRGMGYDPSLHQTKPYITKPMLTLTGGIGAILPGSFVPPTDEEVKEETKRKIEMEKRKREEAEKGNGLVWGLNIIQTNEKAKLS